MMARLILTLIALVAGVALILSSRRRPGLRVLYGVPDTENKYSFVVALVSDSWRFCSGTLMSPVWVHCSSIYIYNTHGFVLTHVQYGDMTKAPNCTQTKAAVEEQISHPGYRPEFLSNDIALLRVTPILLPRYGKISAVDFRSLTGLAVEYAGFGMNEFDDDEERRPRIIGGVVMPCFDYTEPGLYICVAPECSNKRGDSAPGDSGGPLFYDQKVVGVVTAGETPIGCYTAVSPYVV